MLSWIGFPVWLPAELPKGESSPGAGSEHGLGKGGVAPAGAGAAPHRFPLNLELASVCSRPELKGEVVSEVKVELMCVFVVWVFFLLVQCLTSEKFVFTRWKY